MSGTLPPYWYGIYVSISAMAFHFSTCYVFTNVIICRYCTYVCLYIYMWKCITLGEKLWGVTPHKTVFYVDNACFLVDDHDLIYVHLLSLGEMHSFLASFGDSVGLSLRFFFKFPRFISPSQTCKREKYDQCKNDTRFVDRGGSMATPKTVRYLK